MEVIDKWLNIELANDSATENLTLKCKETCGDITIYNWWHRENDSVLVINHWVYRLVLNDWKVLFQMTVFLKTNKDITFTNIP